MLLENIYIDSIMQFIGKQLYRSFYIIILENGYIDPIMYLIRKQLC